MGSKRGTTPSRASWNWETEEEFLYISDNNSDFSKIVLEISQHLELLGGKAFDLVKAWVNKLNAPDNLCVGHSYCKEYGQTWRGARNARARALLRCLRDGRLASPFDAPPSDQPLVPLSPHHPSPYHCKSRTCPKSPLTRAISFKSTGNGGSKTPRTPRNARQGCRHSPEIGAHWPKDPKASDTDATTHPPRANPPKSFPDALSAHKAYLSYQTNTTPPACIPTSASYGYFPTNSFRDDYLSAASSPAPPHHHAVSPYPSTPTAGASSPGAYDRLSQYIQRASEEAAKARAAIDQTINRTGSNTRIPQLTSY